MLSRLCFITHILFTATKLHYGYFMQVIKLGWMELADSGLFIGQAGSL